MTSFFGTTRQPAQPVEQDPRELPADINQGQLDEIFAQLAELRREIEHTKAQQPFILKVSEYLHKDLGALIGSEFQKAEVHGDTKVLTYADVVVTVNAFQSSLLFSGREHHQALTLQVTFAANQQLSDNDVLRILGFMAKIRQGVTGSSFWNGTTDRDALTTDKFSTETPDSHAYPNQLDA